MQDKLKILIICTGNTCRSQMAEGFLKSFDSSLEVFSAGTKAEQNVNPFAVEVMREVGIDLSNQKPKMVDIFLNDTFDYVITVCDDANKSCPVFTGKVMHRLHIGFDDPAAAKGTREEVLSVYREVRDKILDRFRKFYKLIYDGKTK